MQLLKLLFNFDALLNLGPDVLAYGILALVGSALFIAKLGLSLFAGVDDDFDTDMQHTELGSDASFSLFSVLSILAFFMGAGWMGLACRIDWGVNGPVSALIATSFGVAMMFFSSLLLSMTRRLNEHNQYDVKSAEGTTGRVYLTIPAKGEGAGEVQVVVSGSQRILRAVSAGPKLEAFTDVKIVEARPDETMVVAPLDD